MISVNEKKDFEYKGYFIFKSAFNESLIEQLSSESIKSINNCKKIKWKQIRIYRNYPFFLNIFGIDFPLNRKLNSNIFKLFNKINYKKKLLNIVNWKNYQTTVVRLHTNNNFFKYQGEWHRDDAIYPSPNSIQAIIYLKNEKGFRIVPKNKNKFLSNYGIEVDKQRTNAKLGFAKLDKNIFDTIDAKKGDIVFFESGLLHQGFCKTERLHYHLRHEKIDKENDNDNYNFKKEFYENFDVSTKDVNHNYYNPNMRSKINKFKSLIAYFLPRFSAIFYNIRNKIKLSVTHSTIWQ